MALVVFLRGVNIGGHKTFRPTILARQLNRFDAVNFGAAGNFVIWKPITRARLRAELLRRLPFDTEIIICWSREILSLVSGNPFAREPVRTNTARFVIVLSRRPRSEPSLPVSFPSTGRWLLKIFARKDRFVFGLYRRSMKTIRYFSAIDHLFGVPLTSRNWNTIAAIARALTTDRTSFAKKHLKNSSRDAARKKNNLKPCKVG